MTQLPTARGLDPPIVTQFSVFVENRLGGLLELISIFEGQPLRVAALSVLESTDHAVIRVITSDSELCRDLLRRHDLPFVEAPIIIVEIPQDKRMVTICKSLLTAELSIHFAYSLLAQGRNTAALALHTDDETQAGYILQQRGFTLLSEEDLGNNTGPPGYDMPPG